MPLPFEQSREAIMSALQTRWSKSIVNGDEYFADRIPGRESRFDNAEIRKTGRVFISGLLADVPSALIHQFIADPKSAIMLIALLGIPGGIVIARRTNYYLGGRGGQPAEQASSQEDYMDARIIALVSESLKDIPTEDLIEKGKLFPKHARQRRAVAHQLWQRRQDQLSRQPGTNGIS